VASNFELKVFPAQVFQTTIRPHHAQISGEVDSRLPIFRVGQEFGFGELRPFPVARRKKAALNGDLTRAVPTYPLPLVIEQHHLSRTSEEGTRNIASNQRPIIFCRIDFIVLSV
jgi:hypothetical protein